MVDVILMCNQVIIWAGSWVISPGAGVMSVGNCAMLEKGDRSTESEDLYSPLSK